jgi:hypothetical protein
MDFEIIIGDNLYTFEDSVDVSTIICIRIENEYFPNCDWWDFPDSILGMWLYQLVNNRDVSNIEFDLYFMDGPFKLKISKDTEMSLLIQCIHNKFNEVVTNQFICDYYKFMKVLYNAYKRFNYLMYINDMHQGKYSLIYKQSIISMNLIKDIIHKNKK